MRAKIDRLGGEIRFESRVDGPRSSRQRRRCAALVLADGEHLAADHVVLALGHSARDTFEMLHARGVYIEAKPFSIGFRIEHPQSLDRPRRFGPQRRPPAPRRRRLQAGPPRRNGRSVYSFCMCPGGTVVAAASEPGRVVTNGMSQYSRDERNANSGHRRRHHAGGLSRSGDPLAGIAFQRHWEERAFELGGGTYDAPGQLRRRLPRRPALARRSARSCRPTSPACAWAT